MTSLRRILLCTIWNHRGPQYDAVGHSLTEEAGVRAYLARNELGNSEPVKIEYTHALKVYKSEWLS